MWIREGDDTRQMVVRAERQDRSSARLLDVTFFIYTNDGEPLGSAKTVTDTYVVVEKGRIFKHDLYIPMNAFMKADEIDRAVSGHD